MSKMTIPYRIVKFFISAILNIFFRDITIINKKNVPKEGPLIICGNHANQFVDAMMLIYSCDRQISFIIAAKSYKKPVIGFFAKAIGSIPVERPQDLAQTGKGKIISLSKDRIIKGQGTNFLSFFKKGETISIKELNLELIVDKIISDEELEIVQVEDLENQKILSSVYLKYPKIDQNHMYEAVFNHLGQGRVVGIFPEGGSHDRPDLLPIKAGISIMALSGIQKLKKDIAILACGLNYYRAHKFRSKVIVDFGKTYSIPQKIQDQYLISRRCAIQDVMIDIGQLMRDVKIMAPNYKALRDIYTMRSLYIPEDAQLSQDERMKLIYRFSQGYHILLSNNEFKQFLDKIRQYSTQLQKLSLIDQQVQNISHNIIFEIFFFILCIFKFFFSSLLVLPCLFFIGPPSIVLSYWSEKERQKALGSSKVKLKATDVIASYKIMTGIILFPFIHIIHTIIFGFVYNYFQYQNLKCFLVSFYLLYPFFVYYSIRLGDMCYQFYKQIIGKFTVIFNTEVYINLRLQRKALQQQLNEMVDIQGAQYIEDFEKLRVIKKSSLNKDRKVSFQIDQLDIQNDK